MARQRDPRRDEAFEIWKASGGETDLVDIAAQLGISAGTVRGWKSKDNWEAKLNGTLQSNERNAPLKNAERSKARGAPKGNRNAAGNRGGAPSGNQNAKGNKGGPGGPHRNDHAVTHGFFRKYLPEDTAEIIEHLESRAPIDILWDNIMIQYTAIIRAQRIMFVTDRDDKTIERIEEKGGNVWGEKWEVQQAWDKQATFLSAQSRAMSTLQGMITKYEELCRQDQVDEERELRVKKMKLELAEISGENDSDPHQQGKGYEEALNAQASTVFADEVSDHEEA